MCHFKETIVIAAIAVALATSTAFAQDSFRGEGAKMRGDFGNSSRANAGCCPATIPVYATAKVQRRGYHSYSYEAPMRSYRSWSRRS